MEELGLEPNVTLHHFTHPTWFEDLGGFRHEENIPLFVEWAQFMFRTFHKRIKLWATFNEPTVRVLYTCFDSIIHLGCLRLHTVAPILRSIIPICSIAREKTW
jgi:beta-glucosidase